MVLDTPSVGRLSCGALPFLIDLHVHTRLGSIDSALGPKELIESAIARGLSGVAVTEHYRVWTDSEVEEHGRPGFRLFPAAEVVTDVGHVLAFGFARFPRSRSLAALAREARDAGAALVLAHPFRGRLDHWRRPGDGRALLEDMPLMPGVNAIEVCNGGCTDAENQLAALLAEGRQTLRVAGSDAHRATHVGSCSTAFDTLPADSQDLAARLIRREGVVGVDVTGLPSATQNPK